jgi:hypothetical protein
LTIALAPKGMKEKKRKGAARRDNRQPFQSQFFIPWPQRVKGEHSCHDLGPDTLSEGSAPTIPTIRLRIETLSDLVFGLALSIGSITLIEHIPVDAAHLINDVELFAFSFLIVVGIWLGYTRIIAVLPV